ncbi:hypothetical protein BABINDRAFT_162774 [Babjeviella inositovora NRRL Y-12698]|uniref:FCP1 homology domain-containing protein n=1 Tax=Babjeviella inositovora NRRL Y-12698 TaxID=984486 RepID=A0A1E3QLS3_9ASCO|nr:uncharacterized protein BABINDRAFT_162774 [Babjeviella inositovora NRRL Y-12698]ODQ78568.1 hypothetical protein BABINDRAFT_162774 [Babjeviella inositovora NRRL Y-12698]
MNSIQYIAGNIEKLLHTSIPEESEQYFGEAHHNSDDEPHDDMYDASRHSGREDSPFDEGDPPRRSESPFEKTEVSESRGGQWFPKRASSESRGGSPFNKTNKSLLLWLWLPTYLLLYPLMFMLTVLLYPLMFFMKPRPSKGGKSASIPLDEEGFEEPLLRGRRHSGNSESYTLPLDAAFPLIESALDPIKSTSIAQYIFPPPRTLLPRLVKKKTLVLDLDETLIHSLSRTPRGGTAGHSSNTQSTMIEVRLSNMQAATLYHVFKRPYCDEFLRAVSKWFELVVFTASVQEYADPVIDWLEYEQPYFSRRYYRRHCTLRPGAGYIKDLAKVCQSAPTGVGEDLSSVVIVDNSPVSYAMHENNGIMIEGWVNDSQDTELLSLMPLLKGLRLASDVRVMLGLKNGEAAFEE